MDAHGKITPVRALYGYIGSLRSIRARITVDFFCFVIKVFCEKNYKTDIRDPSCRIRYRSGGARQTKPTEPKNENTAYE